MDSEVAPEFIFDQGLYYPANANYYGYYCTGETSSEWDDHHRFFGLDGRDLHFSDFHNGSLSSAYYTPSREYNQSPYNPYNPYIPGAVIGTDGPFIGSQQYFTDSSYQQTVSSSPSYIPVVVQSSSDTFANTSPDALLINTGGAKHWGPTSLRVSLENPTLVPVKSSIHQIQGAGRLSDGSQINSAPSRQFLHRLMAGGSASHVTQGANHFSHGSVPSVQSPLKVTNPVNDGCTNFGPTIRGWATSDSFRPRFQFNRVLNRNLVEQNRGPRISKPKGDLTYPIALRAYTTKAGPSNLQENILIHADQYNKDDFPVDYPDANFFVIKSYSEDDVHKSIKYNVWSSTPGGNKRLSSAYEEAQRISMGKPRNCPVFLFFSVNASGQFCGVAEMSGPVDFHKNMDFWQQDKWTGSFPIKWHIIKDVPNSSLRHIVLVNNEYRPVTNSRDTQEIPYLPGISMLTIFKNSPLKTSMLDDLLYYEDRQKIMHEQKSSLLQRRIYYNPPLFSPTFIPRNKRSDVVAQPPIPDGKEHNASTDQPAESDVKPPNHDKDEGKQQNDACTDGKEPNALVDQAPEVKGDDASNCRDDKPLKSDVIQHNGTLSHPFEADKNSTKSNEVKIYGRSGSGDEQVSPTLTNPLDLGMDGKPDRKEGESDVVTVGMMHIKVNRNSGPFP